MQIWNGSDEYSWRYRADTILSTDGQGDTSIPPFQLRWSGGYNYLQTSNIKCTLVGNKIVDHRDVVGASSVSAAPTTSSWQRQLQDEMRNIEVLESGAYTGGLTISNDIQHLMHLWYEKYRICYCISIFPQNIISLQINTSSKHNCIFLISQNKLVHNSHGRNSVIKAELKLSLLVYYVNYMKYHEIDVSAYVLILYSTHVVLIYSIP